jgi:hypothetical protein
MRLVQAACLLVVGGGALTIGATGCSAANQVRQIFMALDATGDRPRNTFFTDSTEIDCDIVWSGRGTDNSVDVVILQTSGEPTLFDGSNNIVDLGADMREWSASEQAPPSGISTLAFQYTPPQSTMGEQLPFPVGSFKCVVSVNGESAGESDFTISYPSPDCPPGGVQMSTDVSSLSNSCVGYLSSLSQSGAAVCPDASDTNTMCTCTGTGQDRTWTGCL